MQNNFLIFFETAIVDLCNLRGGDDLLSRQDQVFCILTDNDLSEYLVGINRIEYQFIVQLL